MSTFVLWFLVGSVVMASPADTPGGEGWQQTLADVSPAIVSIRVTGTRGFDTEEAGTSVGTGFVVDRSRGLILTNRHMVHAGPVVAEAVLLDHEEVPLRAVYRDPVHDFGFYRFDPSAVTHMDLVELELAPEDARVGMEVRVIGNDAGEKLSILDGTLARLDRAAPRYGSERYNDFNTFYLQAASGTSGGSSGSPVVSKDGRVVGLNAGGRSNAASSFYLPLDRVVRALDLVRAREPIGRGTLQTVFEVEPYDELRRLGLSAETEAVLRAAHPERLGVLSVAEVLPGGPGAGVLQVGDILLRIEDELVGNFVELEAVLDDRVGERLRMDVERAGHVERLEISVGDLHAITPGEYLEVGRGVLHPLSYQQARNHAVPVEGVYLASAGYMWSRAGIYGGVVLDTLDGHPVPDLDTVQRLLGERHQGDSMTVRYHTLDEPHRARVDVVRMDRLWFPSRRCRWERRTGDWPCEDLDGPTGAPESPGRHDAVPLVGSGKIGRKVARALVMVDFDVPHPTAGVNGFDYAGTGVVIDAEQGLVLVDRDTVPVSLGDLSVIFAGTVRVPARVVFLHPVHNVAVIQYDPSSVEGIPISALRMVDRPLAPGDAVWQVGLNGRYRVVEHESSVEQVRALDLGATRTPRHRDYNVSVVSLESPVPSLGGALVDRHGNMVALWASFAAPDDGGPGFRGLPVGVLPAELLRATPEVPERVCALGMELSPIPLVEAQDRGLSEAWVTALARAAPGAREVLEVQRVMGGSGADDAGILPGSLLLAMRWGQEEHLPTGLEALEPLRRVACGGDANTVTLFVEGREQTTPFRGTWLDGRGVWRAVSWAGMLFHEAHPEVALQTGEVVDGVYVAWMWFGTPGARYGMRPTRFVQEVDGIPTPTLDAFLEVVRSHDGERPLRLQVRSLDGRTRVQTLKLNDHDWPLQVFEKRPDGWWSRR